MPEDPRGPLGGIPLYRTDRALRSLKFAADNALRAFEAEDYDTAAAEVTRAKKALNTLAAIRREAKAEARGG